MVRDHSAEMLQGTLDLLVLKTLALCPMHGWGIARHIQQLSRDALSVGQGSVYPSLLRLQNRGLIDNEWGVSENNRRARTIASRTLATESWRPGWRIGVGTPGLSS